MGLEMDLVLVLQRWRTYSAEYEKDLYKHWSWLCHYMGFVFIHSALYKWANAHDYTNNASLLRFCIACDEG